MYYYQSSSDNTTEMTSRDITTLTLQGLLILIMIITSCFNPIITVIFTLIYGYISWDFFARHNLSKERTIVSALTLSVLLYIAIKPDFRFEKSSL